jgi:hypothetical protein
MKILIVLFLLMPFWSTAADLQHRSVIGYIAATSSTDRPVRNIAWLSAVNVDPRNGIGFLNSSGKLILGGMTIVPSAYDSHITHDISEFYSKDKERLKIISNFIFNSPNTIYSLGYDSGVTAKKIKIKSSLFLGVNHVVNLSKAFHFSIGGGAWLGGKIIESPCHDSYDRAFYCPTLTAWSDYQPSYPRPYRYLDLRLTYRY